MSSGGRRGGSREGGGGEGQGYVGVEEGEQQSYECVWGGGGITLWGL